MRPGLRERPPAGGGHPNGCCDGAPSRAYHALIDAVSSQTLAAAPYTATPINGSNNSSNKLTADTVIGVRTNAGRYAKVKVESYGYNLGLRWVTYS